MKYVCKHRLRIFTVILALLAAKVTDFTVAQDYPPVSDWQFLGPRAIAGPANSDGAGKLEAFAVNLSDSSVMYTAGGSGQGDDAPKSEAGIFKSTDGGTTWTATDSGLTDRTIDALWLSQADPRILVALSPNAGIFRSTDAGASWQIAEPWPASALAEDGGTIYVGAGGNGSLTSGIVASKDQGASWAVIQPTMSPVRAVAAGGGTVYAGLDDGTVLVRSNPSSSFAPVTPPVNNSSVWSITLNPAAPASAWVVESGNQDSPDLWETSDFGATWAPLSLPGAIRAQVLALQPASPATLYAGTDGAIFKSGDGGHNWTLLSALTWDVRFLYPWPDQPATLVVGSDQGLYWTTDGGESSQSLNGNISSSLLTSLAVNGTEILTVAQDYNPIASFDGGDHWQTLYGTAPPTGEGGSVVINPGNPAYQYVYSNVGLSVSSDGGQSLARAAQVPRTASAAIAVMASSPLIRCVPPRSTSQRPTASKRARIGDSPGERRHGRFATPC